jgi:phage portal protein BeeE
MKFRSLLPWRATAGRNVVRERKAASGFMSLTAEGKANWTGRSYAGLSREGFMRNPVAHRCVRLVSEATASVPLLLSEGDRERPDHPLLSLLRQPHGHWAARISSRRSTATCCCQETPVAGIQPRRVRAVKRPYRPSYL